MTDKIQKIREEVEKLKSQLIRGACSSQIAMETMCKEEAYNEILAILDSMQEEPVSEKKCMFTKDSYTDEDRKVLCKDCKEKCEYSKKEEPVSEDLEEAANNALNNVLNTHEIVNVRSCLEMFRFGAKWQKQKDSIVSEDLEKVALLYYPKMSRISEPHGIIPADNESHFLGDANKDKREGFITGAQYILLNKKL